MATQVKYDAKQGRRLIVITILAGVILAIGLIGVIGTLIIKEQYVLKKPLTLLLIGMDINIAAPESHDDPGAIPRTDTLILAFIDPVQKKLTLLSVPRDSLVHIPGVGVGRINEASTIGGYDLTKRMVRRLVGCKIDHYLVVNFESFKHLVNLVGGVRVNVDKRMRYATEAGVYKIKLDPGWQVLSGDKALQFVRFRNEPLGDISRVERQRKFLIALYKKLKQPGNIVKLPQFLSLGRKYLKTDLSPDEMLRVVNFARTVDPEQAIKSYTLPGNFYEVYWRPDRKGINKLMKEILPKIDQPQNK